MTEKIARESKEMVRFFHKQQLSDRQTDRQTRESLLFVTQIKSNKNPHTFTFAAEEAAQHTHGYLYLRTPIVTTAVNPLCSHPPEGVLGMTPPTQFTI